MRRAGLFLLPLLLAACSDPTAPTEAVPEIAFPLAVTADWREDVPVPWTHYLAADGGCHVRAELAHGGWPARWGVLLIYPLERAADGTWQQTGLSYMHPVNLRALDHMFSDVGFTFREGTFDGLVIVEALGTGRGPQQTKAQFRCIEA